MKNTSPTPWKIHAYGDLGVDIIDAEGTVIAHMTGKPGCAIGNKPGEEGIIFKNAKLICKLINKNRSNNV